MTLDRRTVIGGGLALAGVVASRGATSGCSVRSAAVSTPDLAAKLRAIETASGGTLGAEFLNVANQRSIGINTGTRFAHASSFKCSLAALLLARHAAGEEDADRLVRWDESEMMRPDTFTRPNLETGATLRKLARAAQRTSDNPAANILLRELGGPAAVTAFWRSIGDDVSRLDRNEPTLNLVPPGEVRDTTTPAAMARTIATLIYGDVLPEAERAELKSWMVETVTGLGRVRAGLREDWLAGDKTGTGLTPGTGGIYIDIGFVEAPEPGSGPVTFAAYYEPAGTQSTYDRGHEAILAQVGQVLGEYAKSAKFSP